MNTFFKRSAVALAIVGLASTSAFAATISSSPLTGTKIKGYYPYMESIGSKVVLGGKVDGTKVFPQVGAVIEVPTYATDANLFKFMDKDGDPSALKSLGNLPDGSAGQKEFKIEWYVITPKAGKKFPDQAGTGTETDVTSWDDVEATLVPGILYGSNQNSQSLVVPESAEGKRLGFIATPTSEYGLPFEGVPVKAWDLGRLWGQTGPTEPGECEAGDDCGTDIGTPGGENPEGGGGDVGGGEYVINIYDAKTHTVVTPGTDLLVDSTYYTTIRIKDDKGQYRDPTQAELDSLKWTIVTDTPANNVSYTSADSRVTMGAGTITNPSGLTVVSSFTTQKVNSDAGSVLNGLAPNFSEQGWSLEVSIEADLPSAP